MKAIYQPSGRAQEYSYWAVNFYNGCSADCSYCYCKRGVLSSVWSTTPTLKKSLEDELTALSIFRREVDKNLNKLRIHGLFFNFTSDPFLKETIDLNLQAMDYCFVMDIPVKALTKQTWWIDEYTLPKNVTIGYTLTGIDEMEKGAATTIERIAALKHFHDLGYKTWVSMEPVINIDKSSSCLIASQFVDHYKIGPLAGKKFELSEVDRFFNYVHNMMWGSNTTVYWKEGFIEKMGLIRESLPGNCVSRDYRWWV